MQKCIFTDMNKCLLYILLIMLTITSHMTLPMALYSAGGVEDIKFIPASEYFLLQSLGMSTERETYHC